MLNVTKSQTKSGCKIECKTKRWKLKVDVKSQN